MRRRHFLLLLNFAINAQWRAADSASLSEEKMKIDQTTLRKVSTLVDLCMQSVSMGDRLSHISEALLGTPYKANRLIGSNTQPEKLVIDLRSVDCLSFLEYVFAISHSTSLEKFITNLIRTRYINSNISFATRRHFFSDWYASNEQLAENITQTLSPHAITVEKTLNQKSLDSLYLPGVEKKQRLISYIPSTYVEDFLYNIKDGDLIGIYSHLPGLDVSHTGLAVWKDTHLFFRNASSLELNKCVVDTLLKTYIQHKSGIIVLRTQ